MKGKFKIYFSAIDIFQSILTVLGVNLKKRVLIRCKELFHFHHIKPVVDLMAEDERFIIHFMESEGFNRTDVREFYLEKQYRLMSEKYVRFVKFDMTIDLDFIGQWIPHSGIKVFVPHGDGMKSNYSGNQALKNYDMVFSMGTRMEELQKPFLKKGATTKKIGFIINDQLVDCDEENAHVIEFKKSLPTVLYAPSWSSNPNMVIMTEKLLHNLSDQDFFNVIFKPHPNLLIPNKCGGKDWNPIFSKVENENFSTVKTTKYPIQFYMKQSDVMISDISSVVFEYLYCNKPIVLHENKDVVKFYQGKMSFDDINKASFHFQDSSEIIHVLKKAIKEFDRHTKFRQELLRTKYFNIGTATQAAIKEIKSSLNL